MSGIAGIYYADGRPVGRVDLDEMSNRIAHRGADGIGVWEEGEVGFVHRLLCTTPESLHERQPLHSSRGSSVLTADARVDNRAELMDQLRVGVSESEVTDADLILASYERWGESCPEHIIGDFAFAIWDGHRRKLFCARDPMGVKPLFYHHIEGRAFFFASEIKALWALPEIPREINDARIGALLTGITAEDHTSTFYKDVFQLAPAHTLSVDRQGASSRRYWRLDPEREIQLGSDDEYAEAFRECFLEAVRCRTRSAYPVSSSLSGGLDSSSVACAARDLLFEDNRPLHAFSAVFPSFSGDEQRRIDERPFMENVVESGGIEPHQIQADLLSPLHDIERMLWHEDEAFWAPNLYLHWAMYDGASEAGARVFLDGFDGDSAVSHGYPRLNELSFGGSWTNFAVEIKALAARRTLDPKRLANRYAGAVIRTFAKEGRWISFLKGANSLHRDFGLSRRKLWVERGLNEILPDFAIHAWRRVRGQITSNLEDEMGLLIDADFARRNGVSPTGSFGSIREDAARTHREAHILTLSSPSLPNALGMLDRAAAAFHVEGRYPFFDRRLLELSVAFPACQKLQMGWNRLVQRRAMEGILPREIQWRPDKGQLGRNFERNLVRHEVKRLERVVEDSSRRLEGYVSLPMLKAMFERCRSESGGSRGDYMGLYTGVMLSLWLEQNAATSKERRRQPAV